MVFFKFSFRDITEHYGGCSSKDANRKDMWSLKLETKKTLKRNDITLASVFQIYPSLGLPRVLFTLY